MSSVVVTPATVVLATLLLVPSSAAAQSFLPRGGNPPQWEVGAQIGARGFNGVGFAGARFTRRATEWLGVEVAAERGLASDFAFRQLIVSARVGGPSRSGGCRPAVDCSWGYFSVGLAVATGLNYRTSRVYGFGAQTPWMGPVALRADLQMIPRGDRFDDVFRAVVGVAIGINRP